MIEYFYDFNIVQTDKLKYMLTAIEKSFIVNVLPNYISGTLQNLELNLKNHNLNEHTVFNYFKSL